jgi:hypothetical protein
MDRLFNPFVPVFTFGQTGAADGFRIIQAIGRMFREFHLHGFAALDKSRFY